MQQFPHSIRNVPLPTDALICWTGVALTLAVLLLQWGLLSLPEIRNALLTEGANAPATLGGSGVLGRQMHNKRARRYRAVACPGHMGTAASIGLDAASVGWQLEGWRYGDRQQSRQQWDAG